MTASLDAAAVAVGSEAPDFELPDQHGVPTRLSSYRGDKTVVLVFYPWAFTSVCTSELCAIRDAMPTFQNDDVQVLVVSCDSVFTLRAFGERERLDYPLLSDFWPHGAVARSYGIFDERRGCALRGTYIIDTQGVVRWSVVNAIPDARDIADYRRVLNELTV